MSFSNSSGRSGASPAPRTPSAQALRVPVGARGAAGGAGTASAAGAAAGIAAATPAARPLGRTASASAASFSALRAKGVPPSRGGGGGGYGGGGAVSDGGGGGGGGLHSSSYYGASARADWALALGVPPKSAGLASPGGAAGRGAFSATPLGGGGGSAAAAAAAGGASASQRSSASEAHRGSSGSGSGGSSAAASGGAGAPAPLSVPPSPRFAAPVTPRAAPVTPRAAPQAPAAAPPQLPATPLPRLPFALADLAMLATVGTGTFGRVRLVQQRSTRMHAALKIMKKAEILRLKQLEHIKSEVRLLSRISHPFIVNLLGATQDARSVYLLLEYVPGGELFSLLRRAAQFGPAQARFYAAEIALALEYLHSVGVAYRDLKPENLLLDAAGHVKIADFGFAKEVRGGERTYTLCGTPEYLAPEIIQSRGHGRGVDWWAFGVLIFEMLAGYPPFYDEAGALAIYAKVLAGRVRYPAHFSAEARDLVRRLLTADRTQRLGCMRGGAADVKGHAWFEPGPAWEVVAARAAAPPHVPPLRGEADTSCFDAYAESDEEAAARRPPLARAEAELFVGAGDF